MTETKYATKVTTIEVMGVPLRMARWNDTDWAVMQDACLAFGKDAYNEKIRNSDWLETQLISVSENRGNLKPPASLCCRADQLLMLIARFSPRELTTEMRSAHGKFLTECATVLNAYFMQGVAVNPRFEQPSAEEIVASIMPVISAAIVQALASALAPMNDRITATESSQRNLTDVITPMYKDYQNLSERIARAERYQFNLNARISSLEMHAVAEHDKARQFTLPPAPGTSVKVTPDVTLIRTDLEDSNLLRISDITTAVRLPAGSWYGMSKSLTLFWLQHAGAHRNPRFGRESSSQITTARGGTNRTKHFLYDPDKLGMIIEPLLEISLDITAALNDKNLTARKIYKNARSTIQSHYSKRGT